MRAKDLHKYKTLDITELSGSPWNTAEKVLGLDENDKVVMAEPEEVVTPEYVDNAIDQAIEAETARTESTYLKEHQSLDDYYTKEEVDQAIEDVEVDLSNYYTKAEVDEAIENVDVSDQLVNYALISSVTEDINTAIANETARTENTYAKPSDIPSLDGYARTTAVTQDIQTAIASETARTEDVYAKKSEIPDLDNYYTKSETDEAIEEAISGISLEGYWTSAQTKNYVDAEITGATASETARTESTYAKKSEIPSLDGYATEQYVDDAIAAIPPVDLSAYAKTTAVTQDIQTAMAAETARTESTYLKEHQSLADYSTTSEVEDMISNATEDMATEEWVEDQGYLTEHQDLSDYAKTTAVTQAIQTAIAAETARTESTYLKEHQDISGKLDVSTFNTYTGATETVLEGKADVADIPDVSGFVTSGDVETQIGTAMASETGRTEDAYVKKNLYDGENENSLTKIRKGVYNAGNQHYDTLSYNYVVPKTGGQGGGIGTLIKKINGQSIIGDIAGFGDESISLPTFNDVSTAITDSMATETARTESTYVKSSELGNYATKEYVDKNLSGYTETRTVEIGDVSNNVSIVVFNTPQGDKTVYFSGTNVDNIYVLRHSDIGGQEEFANLYIDGVRYYPTTGGTPEMSIPAEVPATGAVFEISTTVREVGWYYADSTSPEYFIIDTDALTASFTSTLPTYTLTVPGKQDTLVSGTNIKTINNQSILGSGNIDIKGGSGPIIPAITSLTDYEAISGDVKNGDLIQVQGVDINGDGGEAYGLFQAEVDQGSDSISWERKDNADSLMWADKMYPWMAENDVWPVDFGEGHFLISTDDNSEDEAYNGIGFDADGKPVTTHIVPEYDEQTGEVTGMTRTDTPIGADDGSTVRYDIDREAELANAGYNTKLITQEYDENEGATLPTIVGYMEEGMLNGVKIDGHSIAKVSGYIHQQSEPTPGPVFEFTQNDELATQAYVTAATENLASQGYVDAAITAATNDLATEAYVTAATATKQDTLVSGTNIKTINNQSLLGSGNIDIQGGGGGGSVVELTKAQYEALDPPAADTTYIITDAETVDLNDYAPASGLTELSGTVETLSSTKADKASTTARNGYYFPAWNEQGIITGTAVQAYAKNQSINGSSFSVIAGNNNNHPSFYAPTSAGTAGQPLLSNGSGAPVWGGYKFAFITQTQYDALSTKDATTIYFITGD